MLSTIGRAALKRVGVGACHSRPVAQCTLQLQRLSISQSQVQTESAHLPQFATAHGRSYATAAKIVAKPRVKKAAAAATATKKPAAKKPVKVKKPVKAKKPAKAKKAKKVVKKVLTEAQLARKAARDDKAKMKELKAAALISEPKLLPTTAWSIAFGEGLKATSSADRASIGLKTLTTALAEKYKNLSAAEREALNHRASENKAKNEADYVKWVESFTPDQIRIANNARISIKKRLSASGIKFKQGSYSQIKDSRQPHPHIAATNIFIREKHATGDFKGIGFAEASAQLHREWKAMSEAEKKPYRDAQAADLLRYQTEFKTTFGREPTPSRSSTQA